MNGFAYQDGAPAIPGLYPSTQDIVLAAIAAASGIAIPDDLSFNAVLLTPTLTPVVIAHANAGRSFLLIYNPTAMVQQFSLGTAYQGALSNLTIGPGQAYFWATAQALQPVYTGDLTAVTEYAVPLPLWVWEDSTGLYDNGGELALIDAPADWPISPVGLPVGAIWNNGLVPSVVPGFVPNPAAPKLFFGSITAEQLLRTGGGNLPLSNPGAGTLQLWNNGGAIAIA
jgi:hypothetical protein